MRIMKFSKFWLETGIKLGLSKELPTHKLAIPFATVNRCGNGKAIPQKSDTIVIRCSQEAKSKINGNASTYKMKK